MSFPRYPVYKDSGVEWLGELPGHWDLRRIGYFFTERREKVSDKDFPALSVTKNGIVPQLDTAAKSDDGDNRKRVCKGDFVINSRSDRKGSAGASDLDGSVSLICTVMQPQEKVHTPFVHHLLRSQPFQEEFYRNGKGIVADLWSTNYSEMRNIMLGMPPILEQTQIAVFLDRETAKIDALVAEQRRLMALLKEKRQAVISHAVTWGLNPDAPMKPSGIEWLGDVPEHWEVKRFQRCVYVAEGQVDPENPTYSEMPLIAPNHVESGTGRLLELESASEQGAVSGKYLCKAGDVVYSKIRPALRKVCIAPEDCLCSADMYPLRAHSGLVNAFLLWSILSEQFSALAVLESQRVAMPKINRESLKEVMLAVPPIAEQEAVTEYIENEAAKFDTLTTEAQRAIDLLQERRTALISAAVTGEIDLRGAV